MKTNNLGRVLGIDPGLDRTGWAVAEHNGTAGFVLCACGLIHTDANLPLQKRLSRIYDEIKQVANIFAPQSAAMEEMFFLKRAYSVSHTIQTRGVILLALEQCGLEVSSYLPKRVKITLCGSGAADKKQMQRMTQLVFKLKEVLSPDDVADAAAIALCHLKTAPFTLQMSAQQKFLDKIKEAKKEQAAKLKIRNLKIK